MTVVCHICRKPVAEPRGYKSHEECRWAQRPRYRKTNRKRRAAALKAGRCGICKRRKAIEGTTSCGFCAERRDEHRDSLRDGRVEVGLCPCGATREDPTLIYCAKCRAAGSRRSCNSWRNREN